jgi:hypothetical protein
MGEIADMILMGFMCQQCGMPIDGDATGYPRCCEDCAAVKENENIER